MEPFLNDEQNDRLKNAVKKAFDNERIDNRTNEEYIEMYLSAKQLEGLSARTIYNYRLRLNSFNETLNKSFRFVNTDDIRQYLTNYQSEHNCGNGSLENIRGTLSGFFIWLEQEEYIFRSPVHRINKIKQTKKIKKVINDESLEKLRINCKNERDLAMVDMLSSTGIRASELVELNITDINFEERECIVHGKGDKYRPAYFDARTKYHLQTYLKSRTDDNPALFVSLIEPHARLTVNGVERRIRNLGRKSGCDRVHPHMFRRTMATRAIEKGMPVEQVQKILGHNQIGTTMMYAIVNQNLVKQSHRKYLT